MASRPIRTPPSSRSEARSTARCVRSAWRWIAGFVRRDQEDPGVLTLDQRESGVTSDPPFGADQRERRSVSTALSMRGGGTTWRHQSRLNVEPRDEDDIRTILLAPGAGRYAQPRSRDRRYRRLLRARTQSGRDPDSALRIGVEVERQHLDSRYLDVVDGEAVGAVVAQADGARVRAGAFVSSSWMPASQVRLFGAIRWDYIDDSDFEDAEAEEPTRAWSPRAGVVVQPTWLGGASLFAQVLARVQGADTRSALRPATLSGFPGRHVHDFESHCCGAARLQRRSRRVGREQPASTGSPSVYRMAVEDEIDFDARTFSYGNIGRSRHTGLELEVQGQASSWLRPMASHSLSDVADADASGDAVEECAAAPGDGRRVGRLCRGRSRRSARWGGRGARSSTTKTWCRFESAT